MKLRHKSHELLIICANTFSLFPHFLMAIILEIFEYGSTLKRKFDKPTDPGKIGIEQTIEFVFNLIFIQ